MLKLKKFVGFSRIHLKTQPDEAISSWEEGQKGQE